LRKLSLDNNDIKGGWVGLKKDIPKKGYPEFYTDLA